MRDLITMAMPSGMSEGFDLAGAPLKTIDVGFVNGRMYLRLTPLVGGGRDLPAPSKSVLWLMTRLHPAFRKRAKRSVRAIDERFWLQESDRWEREWKPKLIATNRRLGDIDAAVLSDADLVAHLNAVWRHVEWAGSLHFRLHTSDLAPIGRLLTATRGWGLDERKVMTTLAGASPATSAPTRALRGIADELARVGVNPATLSDVREASDRAAELLDEYLAEFGNRVTTGYDLSDRTLRELPRVILASIRHSCSAEPSEIVGDQAFNSLLEQIDESASAEFTNLVVEARTLYGLRDENGPLTVEWPAGIARHVILEAGRRLVARGALDVLEHVFDAAITELGSLLEGAEYPLAAELGLRHQERVGWAALTAPLTLGPVAEPPDIDILPGRMPEMMRAILTVTTLLDSADQTDSLSGTGVGSASYRGIARVVADADEAFERVNPGDIIVTRLTVPTYNSVLTMAGGVVTEAGGLLSHTAVIARELGIPAVIGVAGALIDIPDGAEIILNPVAGTVTIV
ncbi:PEP-utilizing enzyme [uncultured Ilumatobacter sp.]|uniref:PEP-utilizing enzyme n=1 Tax=uncultured Ilumatobacter sp. TaxID=879968 RepID=UPI00374F523D